MIVSENDKKRKIFICTTFRDFNGTENDEIQKLFLKSLKNQTYQNFELVVTIFKEKNVENKIKEFNLPVKFYYDSSQDYKYSHTEVLLNCIKEADNILPNCIFIWTTADVILEKDFFENINKYLPTKAFATSIPHLIYKGLDSYFKKESHYWSLIAGIDTIFFDGSVVTNDFLNDLKFYKNINYGYFEYFLTALGIKYANSLLNFQPINNIHKIMNPNIPTIVNYDFIKKSENINKKTFFDFVKKNKMNYKFYLHGVLYYRPIKNKLNFYWKFKHDIIYAIFRYLKFSLKTIIMSWKKN